VPYFVPIDDAEPLAVACNSNLLRAITKLNYHTELCAQIWVRKSRRVCRKAVGGLISYRLMTQNPLLLLATAIFCAQAVQSIVVPRLQNMMKN
jgi:hypothetical protein